MRSQSESRVFEFLQPSVDEKHLMRSQSESQVFKFLQPSADEKRCCVLRVKAGFSNFSSLVWTKNI